MKTKMCAFLRGVNVNGKNMKMSDVCDVFRQEKMQNVNSVLATGNILFESELAKADVRPVLESALSKHFETDIHMFIKDEAEVGLILSSSPFPPNPELHIYAFICEDGFEETLMEKFKMVVPAPNEKAQISNGYFLWQVEKGATLDSGFSKILGEKKMKDQFTSRNINTIQKIRDKMHSL